MRKHLLAVVALSAGLLIGNVSTSPASAPVSTMNVPAAPTRVYDSRTTQHNSAPLVANELINPIIPVAPGTQVVAVNVTVIAPSAAGYVKVWSNNPSGVMSTQNFAAGQTIAAFTIVTLADLNSISIQSTASCHVVVDLVATWS